MRMAVWTMAVNNREEEGKPRSRALAYCRSVGVLAADGEQDLADGHPGTDALRLAKSTTHACLEPISTSAGKHLVDAQHVEGVDADAQVECVLACVHLLSTHGSLECRCFHSQ